MRDVGPRAESTGGHALRIILPSTCLQVLEGSLCSCRITCMLSQGRGKHRGLGYNGFRDFTCLTCSIHSIPRWALRVELASAPGKPMEVATEGRRGGLYCLLEKQSMAVTPGTPRRGFRVPGFPTTASGAEGSSTGCSGRGGGRRLKATWSRR